MGKIDTETILLVGLAAVAVYLLTRPKTTTTTTTLTPVYNPVQYQPVNETAQDIAAGGQAATSLANALSNLF